MKVYHGTTSERHERILTDGYIKAPVYVAATSKQAAWFAYSAPKAEYTGDPIVLELEVPQEWLYRDRYLTHIHEEDPEASFARFFGDEIYLIRKKVPAERIVRVMSLPEAEGPSLIDFLREAKLE